MLITGDTLLCTDGNEFYEAGKVYRIGEFINDKYFELPLDDGCWYGTIDDKGIYVQFNSTLGDYNNAWFEVIEDTNDNNIQLNFFDKNRELVSNGL